MPSCRKWLQRFRAGILVGRRQEQKVSIKGLPDRDPDCRQKDGLICRKNKKTSRDTAIFGAAHSRIS
jgi:hypothetical protein